MLALGPLAEGIPLRPPVPHDRPQNPRAPRTEHRVQGGLLDPKMLWKSLPDALRKLDPRTLWRNPVMFIVEIGAAWTTVLAIIDPTWFAWLIVVWLWLTVVFANLAEAVAEGRGKAQAETLRRAKTETMARRLTTGSPARRDGGRGRRDRAAAGRHRRGRGRRKSIPGDGDVLEGIACVDESAITGESAPVIRESGGDRSAVTGGTTVLSRPDRREDHPEARRELHRPDDRARRGRQPAEDAQRDRAEHPAGRADDHLRLRRRDPAAAGDLLQGEQPRRAGQPGAERNGVTGIVMVSLLVCLIPTTIGALLSAIGIAGMDRLVQRNVLAMSGRAVEAAGDVNTLLLDKTGTITLGNRQAADFVPLDGVAAASSWPTPRSCPAWPTRRRRAAPSSCSPRNTSACARARRANSPTPTGWRSPPQTRMSRRRPRRHLLRKGAASSVAEWVRGAGR